MPGRNPRIERLDQGSPSRESNSRATFDEVMGSCLDEATFARITSTPITAAKALLVAPALVLILGLVGCGPSPRLLPDLSATDEIKAYTRASEAAPIDQEAMRSLGFAYTRLGGGDDPFAFYSKGRLLGT